MFGLDLFNTKKMRELKSQLSLAKKEIVSLQADVKNLERLNYELQAELRLSTNSKIADKIKSAESHWQNNSYQHTLAQPRPEVTTLTKEHDRQAKQVGEPQSTTHPLKGDTKSNSNDLLMGVVLGAALVCDDTNRAEGECYSNSNDTIDCSVSSGE